MKAFFSILVLPLLCASCASDGSGNATSGNRHRSLSQRITEKNGYTQTSEGEWIPTNNRRSSYDSQRESVYSDAKTLSQKEFQTGEFAKKSWWATQTLDSQPYEGPTDGSRFHQSAALAKGSAQENRTASTVGGTYQTGNVATSSAREASGTRFAKPSDAETDLRRRVYAQPEIVDWKAQRGFSVGEIKTLLGKE